MLEDGIGYDMDGKLLASELRPGQNVKLSACLNAAPQLILQGFESLETMLV